MRKMLISGLAAVVLAVPLAGPAAAMPIDTTARAAHSDIVDVAFRGQRGRWRHNYGVRRWDNGYDRGRRGFGVAAGLAGLAAGAIIGGAIAGAQTVDRALPVEGPDGYCADRFRSYDPASGTYMGYDGRRRSCP